MSRRESQVLRLICEGHNNNEIAHLLGIRPGTAKNYVGSLLLHLGVRSRLEAAKWGMQHPSAFGPDRSAPRRLHPAGCGCAAIYCASMRVAVREVEPAA